MSKELPLYLSPVDRDIFLANIGDNSFYLDTTPIIKGNGPQIARYSWGPPQVEYIRSIKAKNYFYYHSIEMEAMYRQAVALAEKYLQLI
jgi:hypothetical protein